MLASAVRTGGEFAEVFAEDKRSTSAGARRRADRAGHQRPRPWRRHPRRQGRHHRLRPHRRPVSERGLLRRRRGGRGGRQPGRRRRAHDRPDAAQPAPRSARSSATPTRCPRPTKVALLRTRRRRGPLGRRRRSSRCRPATPTVAQADPRRQHRRRAGRPTSRSARSMRISVVANGDAGMQTGFQSMGQHRSASRCSTASTSRSSPATRPARRSPSSAPGRRRAARCPSSSSAAAAACCSTRRAATASRPTSSPRAPACTAASRASWSPRRSSRSSTTAR